MNLKLEVVIVPVSDIDRAKEFYERLGFREDIDAGGGGVRAVQLTPPGSTCSIIFGTGVTSAKPGSLDRLLVAVDDVVATRAELVGLGVEVSEVFHDVGGGLAGGIFTDPKTHAPGPDPERRSYASYATFRDPDGNVWLMQELKERLPGRV